MMAKLRNWGQQFYSGLRQEEFANMAFGLKPENPEYGFSGSI